MVARNKILIVDDMEVNRVILGEVFGDQYSLLEAENGKQALELLAEHADEIVAVLLDVMMPIMGGFEALKQMQAKGYPAKIPVFLITADYTEENMRQGYNLGVMDIIGKPIVPYFLKRRIDSVIELFRAREELAGVVERQEIALEEKANEIQQLNSSIIETLATAIEFRDCESGEHVRRIYDLTKLILIDWLASGQADDAYGEEDIEQIATAAIMHDVGKIAIPDIILNKPGRLSDEEFEIMKLHTVRGCEILERIPKNESNPIYRYAYDICRSHHEKWDGGGYPDGLVGDEISIWAQMVALADCYDALLNERIYKPAYTHEESMRMIVAGECGQFKPELLELFASRHQAIIDLYEGK